MTITIEDILIPRIKVTDAVNIIIGVGDGGHYLVVYPNLLTLQKFYTYLIHKLVSERKGIVYLDLFYESLPYIRKTIIESPFGLNVESLEKEEKVMITEPQSEYPQEDKCANYKSNFSRKVLDELVCNENSICSFLSDMGSFVHAEQIKELVDYELNLASVRHPCIKFICLYHKEDFNAISEEQKEILVKSHLSAITIKSF